MWTGRLAVLSCCGPLLVKGMLRGPRDGNDPPVGDSDRSFLKNFYKKIDLRRRLSEALSNARSLGGLSWFRVYRILDCAQGHRSV